MDNVIKMKRILIISFVFLCGCSVKYYEKSADKDIKEIWNRGYKKVQKQTLPENALKEKTFSETRVLALSDVIKIGLENNREYKSKKEDVYFKILDFTYQRYLFKTNMDLVVMLIGIKVMRKQVGQILILV